MTLPVSGTISLSDVLVEIQRVTPGRSPTISLGDADVLALAGKSGLPVSMSDLYGKSSYIAMSATLSDLDMSGAAGAATSYTEHASISLALSGGQAPFSYAWLHVSGVGSIDATNAATSTVNMPVSRNGQIGDISTQVVQVVVTDATGAQITKQATVVMTLN